MYLVSDDIRAPGSDAEIEIFNAGVDFTPGTSAGLTLATAPGSENHIEVYFDGVTQHHDQYTLVGTTLSFTSVIPIGTSAIEVRIIVPNAALTPADDSVTFPKLTESARKKIYRKNAAINGGFTVHQRGLGSVAPFAFQYNFDRFKVYNGDAASVFNVSAAGAPWSQGARGYQAMRVEVTTANIGSYDDFATISYAVEGYDAWNMLDGLDNDITLSFWARTNVAGTYNVAFLNNLRDRVLTHPFTLLANTWTKVTMTIPFDTFSIGGTWEYTNNTGLLVRIMLDRAAGFKQSASDDTWLSVTANSTFFSASHTPGFANTIGNFFEIADYQIESGANATEFEQMLYEDLLANCQRYYYSADNVSHCGRANNTNAVFCDTKYFPTEMRATPTATIAGGGQLGGTGAVLVVDSITNKKYRLSDLTGTYTIGEAIILFGNLTFNADF